ncbi:MAG: hypothetical protein RBG13Loki_2566 [Promethearchaeota archaeon CR_4]|nr:MAG: hypothetical protein RBG13Loki_2566 [Candidatus Lokiarchaeota archaeon CR_4]
MVVQMGVTEQWDIVSVIQEGRKGLAGRQVPSPLQKCALSLMFRFCQRKGVPRDLSAFQAAAAYIAARHPLSYPNRVPRETYADDFAVRGASLEWYLKQILATLDFKEIRDDEHYPYYIDPLGVIWRMTQALVEAEVIEAITGSLTGQSAKAREEIIAEITHKIVAKVNAVPVDLAVPFKDLIAALVDAEMAKARPYVRLCRVLAR